MAYELRIAEKDELRFCFRLSGEAAERTGAIGYLRADFGRSGREFHTTWFDNQVHLKSPAFKAEFDELINSLRDDGQKPPFASRANHSDFCAAHPSMTCFKVATLDYSFYFRLNPHQGTYDIYCFAYDNRYLLPELAGKHDLPLDCLTLLPSTKEIVYIMKDSDGYYPPFAGSTKDPAVNRKMVDEQNKKMGVTRAQEEAMKSGSMFGWDTPAAKPWNYNENGKPRPLPQKNKTEPDRG
jgi:hypothetical protein